MKRPLITKERILLTKNFCPICQKKLSSQSFNTVMHNEIVECHTCLSQFSLENNVVIVNNIDLEKFTPVLIPQKYMLKTDKEADVCTVIKILKAKGITINKVIQNKNKITYTIEVETVDVEAIRKTAGISSKKKIADMSKIKTEKQKHTLSKMIYCEDCDLVQVQIYDAKNSCFKCSVCGYENIEIEVK